MSRFSLSSVFVISKNLVLPQVYSASNVELITKTRTEHLSDQDKTRNKGIAHVNYFQFWTHVDLTNLYAVNNLSSW